ncbi:MAG TPA: NADPH:quinone oxidoreductase family protein, partial [Sphingomonas sp.]
MRALTVTALSDDLSGVALLDAPDPERRPGQILVRVRAAALNHPDLLMTRGAYQLKPPLPFALGMEMAGEVVEADAESGFRPGDRVAAGTRLGAFADLVAVDAAAARPIPPEMDDAAAAALGAAHLTAHVALVRLGRLQAGEWVLVHGAAGGVGLAAVDLAKALGARVIATSRSAEKRALIEREYRPDAVLPASGFREAVKELTGGGADLVFDPVGGDVFDESTRCVAFGGRLLVVGFTSGRIATLPTNIALIKGFSVIGVRAGEHCRRFPALGRESLDAVWSLAAAGRIRPR